MKTKTKTKTKTNLDTTNLLEQVASHNAISCFNPDYINNDNVTERKLNGLGIALAQYTGYTGKTILEICKYALEDANFHSEVDKIQKIIDKL